MFVGTTEVNWQPYCELYARLITSIIRLAYLRPTGAGAFDAGEGWRYQSGPRNRGGGE